MQISKSLQNNFLPAQLGVPGKAKFLATHSHLDQKTNSAEKKSINLLKINKE
jgi:hypothetical protein